MVRGDPGRTIQNFTERCQDRRPEEVGWKKIPWYKTTNAGHVPVELRLRTSVSLLSFVFCQCRLLGRCTPLVDKRKQALRHTLFFIKSKTSNKTHVVHHHANTINKANTDLSDSRGHFPQRPRLRPEEVFPQLPLPVSDQLLPPLPYRLCTGHGQNDHDGEEGEEDRLLAAARIIFFYFVSEKKKGKYFTSR